ncbi:ubiquitin C-terminal hydrolase 13-like [Andrographis paniculata]|uniref:ubiquitin C-terminal hydrolase 13-like n=1 Tax=Andrographis paniculata TaxID=175694 RepID=UPI0021E99A58|nr:ubiquitin C-terminal hydrolase 13-like [Andrographis paniculata]
MDSGNRNTVPIINLRNQEKEMGSTSCRSGETPQPVEEVFEEEIATYPMYGKFIWRHENVSRLSSKVVHSRVYVLGDSKWRIFLQRMGQGDNDVSLYIKVANAASLPFGWTIYVEYKLTIINQFTTNLNFQKASCHHFNAKDNHHGFSCFMPLEVFRGAYFGYTIGDACSIEVEIISYGVTKPWPNSQKKEIEFVGLKNQGATCYLNSLLQTLYYISYFRKVVYQMPTNHNDEPKENIPLALQRLFYNLQHSESSVATNELTRSFGWDQSDAFVQHDVQEMNRLLCEALEESMKGTAMDGALRQLFEGHHKYYIECINVDYTSSRTESFYDLQLDVKGCRDVYASLDKFIEVEHLDNDNKYHAGHFGLQDARKGILFMDFPPVLQLHLKRFEYDIEQGIFVKINDRYEFPIQLDLDKDNGKYLSPEADKTKRNLYTLQSVLVHSGGIDGGHYYVYIRPDLSSNHWYKFDDEKVSRQDVDTTIEGLYGGEQDVMPSYFGMSMKNSNAYMLVYIRESDKENILCAADENDIAMPLRERLRREIKGMKEIAETDAHTVVKVATDEDISNQIGSETYFDLVNFDNVRGFHVWRFMPLNIFKDVVAKDFGFPSQYLRYWICAERNNGSCRPLRALTSHDSSQSVGDLHDLYGIHGPLKLFLELEIGPDSCLVPPPSITTDDILLFFKIYDPEYEKLRYAGRLFVNHFTKPTHILTKLNELAGLDAHQSIELYEEISQEPHLMCEPIDKDLSFMSGEIGNGDIVCFQKSISPEIMELLSLPDIPTFLKYQHIIQYDNGEK